MATEKELTGFEDTGEEDTFGQIETEVKAPKKIEEKEIPDQDDPLEKEKTKEELEKEAKELGDENDKDLDIFEEKKEETGKKGKKIEKKEGDDTEEKEEEAAPELFDTTDLEKGLEEEQEITKTSAKVNWTKMAKAIKLPNDLKLVVEDNTIEAFNKAVQKTVEDARKITAFSMDHFEEDQKEIINYFLNKGTRAELLNPLKEIDDVILQPAEEKVLAYFINAEGLSEAAAQEKLNTLIEEDTLDKKIKSIDVELHGLRETRYKEIISKTFDRVNEQTAKIQKEKKEMVDYVEQVDSFMGMKLPDKLKTYIKKEIETGKLSSSNNNAETQINARLFMLYGNQILAKIKEDIKNSSRDSYNKGLETEIRKIHNLPPKQQAQPAVKTKVQEGIVDPLALFANIDQDAIDNMS